MTITQASIHTRPLMPRATGFLATATYNAVIVTCDDGTTAELFRYYPDELTFSPDEFVGLSPQQALSLYHNRDLAYLRS